MCVFEKKNYFKKNAYLTLLGIYNISFWFDVNKEQALFLS